MNKILICGFGVISNPTMCDVCGVHAAVFSEMELFAVLGFYDSIFSNLTLT